MAAQPGDEKAAEDADEGRPYGGMSLAERRRDQRDRLLRAAIDAFAEQGFAASSVEDVVRRARTSRASFYHFFENREDCLLEAYRKVAADLRGRLFRAAAEAPEGDPVETGVRAYVTALLDDPNAARLFLVEAVGASPALEKERAAVRTQFAQVIRSGWATINPGAAASPDAEALTVGLVGALGESMVHLVSTGRLSEAPRYVPALTHLLRSVFAPSPPARRTRRKTAPR